MSGVSLHVDSGQAELDRSFMQQALLLAEKAALAQEVPVGAVLVMAGEVVGSGWNQPISQCDPSAHAEIMAIRAAAQSQSNYRLPNSTLYVTIEPCAMCLGAIVHARVSRIVFGALEPKSGVLVSNTGLIDDDCFNHYFEYEEGVCASECSAVISTFFKQRRELKARLKAQL
ncbi:MAG: tRNA(adenine34) deaminase [Flavobacteriales bacterium]|jgi:tRNA(adenine34) deaminase